MTDNTCSECFWFNSTDSTCTADAEPVDVLADDEACECFDERD